MEFITPPPDPGPDQAPLVNKNVSSIGWANFQDYLDEEEDVLHILNVNCLSRLRRLEALFEGYCSDHGHTLADNEKMQKLLRSFDKELREEMTEHTREMYFGMRTYGPGWFPRGLDEKLIRESIKTRAYEKSGRRMAEAREVEIREEEKEKLAKKAARARLREERLARKAARALREEERAEKVMLWELLGKDGRREEREILRRVQAAIDQSNAVAEAKWIEEERAENERLWRLVTDDTFHNVREEARHICTSACAGPSAPLTSEEKREQ